MEVSLFLLPAPQHASLPSSGRPTQAFARLSHIGRLCINLTDFTDAALALRLKNSGSDFNVAQSLCENVSCCVKNYKGTLYGWHSDYVSSDKKKKLSMKGGDRR